MPSILKFAPIVFSSIFLVNSKQLPLGFGFFALLLFFFYTHLSYLLHHAKFFLLLFVSVAMSTIKRQLFRTISLIFDFYLSSCIVRSIGTFTIFNLFPNPQKIVYAIQKYAHMTHYWRWGVVEVFSKTLENPLSFKNTSTWHSIIVVEELSKYLTETFCRQFFIYITFYWTIYERQNCLVFCVILIPNICSE